ncbi:hypothetical protein GCM10010413_39010 [Promicromonospora sukumoe]|uniref:DhaL domain-containing protein n=1 Tax=Promicromonospora sukumoe TaxID=88382 RepID=A0A7W3JBA5_9MICO|nr:DAK2 domain-containing protein [Promicromonospora sukumoe]MBA8809691.1 hypothetical protein [Promicromonospora sukumoe]
MTDVDSGSRTADSGPGQYPEQHQAVAGLDDPGLVRAWTHGATAALRRERDAIDRVNVFPVADADTGTNLYLTLREGDRAVAAAPADTTGARLLAALARAALLGARGNSGVILSEWLRGLAVAARRGGTTADLLTRAAASARSAVAVPAEGTILTAADAAGAAARAAETPGGGAGGGVAGAAGAVDGGVPATGVGPLHVVTAAAAAARASARASRDELDVLRTAGVLDAGALGLVLVLDALVVAAAQAAGAVLEPEDGGSVAHGAAGGATGVRADGTAGGVSVVRGSMDAVTLDQLLDAGALPSAPAAADPGTPAGAVGSSVTEVVPVSEPRPDGAGSGALELMFVLTGPGGEAADTVAAGLRGALAEVGDSVVVVGGDSGAGTAVWQAHVHTDHLDQALAIAAGAARAGSLSQVHVRHLEAAGQHDWGVVAATSAPALAGELAHTGAVVLLTGGVDAAVAALTPDDAGRAAASTGARRVLLLGTPDVTAATDGHLDVDELITVPAPTDVHAVVALAALGTLLPVGLPDAVGALDPVDAHAIVTEALAALTVRGTTAAAAVDALRQAADPETTVVTALLDTGVPGDLADSLAAVLAERAPDAELVVLPTGRPGDGVQLGTESADTESADPEAYA